MSPLLRTSAVATGNYTETVGGGAYTSTRPRRQLFRRLNRWELPLVRAVVTSSAHPVLRQSAKVLNWLGNGWIYLLLAIPLLCVEATLAARMIVAGGVSAGICFAIYPRLKRGLARLRPFRLDRSIKAMAKPLDFYSCPSGHCLAATLIAIPLSIGIPATLPATLSLWSLIAWSRVSTGHHFPTDLAAGALLASAVAVPISLFIL